MQGSPKAICAFHTDKIQQINWIQDTTCGNTVCLYHLFKHLFYLEKIIKDIRKAISLFSDLSVIKIQLKHTETLFLFHVYMYAGIL